MSSLPAGTGDKASVWRLLADFAKRDILRRMDLGDRAGAELAIPVAPPMITPIFCEACGAVSCLPELEVRAVDGSILWLSKGQLSGRIMGVCATCAVA